MTEDKIAEWLAHMDGARMAHRHVLAFLLEQAPAERVKAFFEDLHNSADLAEQDMGERRIAGYRSELDAIMNEALDIRKA